MGCSPRQSSPYDQQYDAKINEVQGNDSSATAGMANCGKVNAQNCQYPTPGMVSLSIGGHGLQFNAVSCGNPHIRINLYVCHNKSMLYTDSNIQPMG